MADPRTNSGAKLYIAVDGTGDALPQNTDLNLAAYQALTWLEISNVGSFGETGTNTNVVSYDTLDTEVTKKGKGISNAGDAELELARDPADLGQIELRAAALTRDNYAFKYEQDDQITPTTGNGTTYYNRGLVAGPRHPNGRNEAVVLEVYTLGMNQKEIVEEAT